MLSIYQKQLFLNKTITHIVDRLTSFDRLAPCIAQNIPV